MALDLTPEQQEIFDRVVGIVTQNDELRHQFKTAVEEINKHRMAEDINYMADSEEEVAVNYRTAINTVREEIKKINSELKTSNPALHSKTLRAICDNFLDY